LPTAAQRFVNHSQPVGQRFAGKANRKSQAFYHKPIANFPTTKSLTFSLVNLI
jgi:hypothetical protein